MPNKPKTMASTYRFSDDFISLLDRLGERLGGIDRTATIRLAVQRLADAEMPPEAQKKTSKKSAKSS